METLKALANPQFLELQPYSAGKAIDEIMREYGLADLIRLSSNENTLGPCDEAIQASLEAVYSIHRYPENNHYTLKYALAEHCAVNPDNITLGNGSDELFGLFISAFAEPGSDIITSEYTFPAYETAARVRHVNPIIAPAKNYHYDLAEILNRLTSKTRLIFISNPNNPTGCYITSAQLSHFMKQVPGTILVVVDEAYFEYATATDYPNSITLHREFPNLITTRTFSKIHGLAGLRVGYAIAHREISNILDRIRCPYNINIIAQKAAVAALYAKYHVDYSIANNERGLQQLQTACQKLNLTYLPTAANFLTIDFAKPALPVYQALLKSGVLVRPLADYQMPNFLRITIGDEKELAKCITAMTRVLDNP